MCPPLAGEGFPPDTRIGFEGLIDQGLAVRSWRRPHASGLAEGFRWLDRLRQERIDATGVPFQAVRLLIQLPAAIRLSSEWFPGDRPVDERSPVD